MKVPNGKGIVNHTGPESCVADRKVSSEALTRVRVGWAIEPRNRANERGADAVAPAEGNTCAIAIARMHRASRGPRTQACTHAPRAGSGRSYVFPQHWRNALGSPRTGANDERA